MFNENTLKQFLIFFLTLICILETESARAKIPLIKNICSDTVELNFNKPIYLNPKENYIRITLNANQLCDSFAYFLKDIDKKPYTTIYPEKSYTNISGGEHILYIWKYEKGTPKDSSTIFITVGYTMFDSAWYRPTVWLCLGLVIMILVYFWIMYDLRQRNKVIKFRTALTADLHDDVGSSLTSIIVFTKLVKRQIPKQLSDITEIVDDILITSQNALENLRDTVSVLNPDKDNIYDLLERIRTHTIKNLKANDIQVDFKYSIDTQKLDGLKTKKIAADRSRNCFLIFKELIQNIIKHSKATIVSIEVQLINNELLIYLKDNGIGYNMNEKYEGHGISSIQYRAKESLILIDTQSAIGKGTQVNIELPIL